MKIIQISAAIASTCFHAVVFIVCAAATVLLLAWDYWKGDRYGI